MTESVTKPSLLAVGGLDPTGGAGLLLDAAAARHVGVHAAVVVAVVTVQDGGSFALARPEDPALVREAVDFVLRALPVGAVKIGALGSAGIVEALTEASQAPSFPPLVVDPVMRSTTGGVLLDREGVAALAARLLPRSALVTPNLAEAAILAGCEVGSVGQMEKAARRILELGAGAVLVKGGHLDGDEAVDVFVDRTGTVRVLRSPRLPVGKVRGTGCALASLVAALLAKGEPLEAAVERGRKLLLREMGRARRVGPGPLVLDFSGAPAEDE
ncbi:MAG: PfkB family carbohydrate kinase [Deltaproteobacteria bacterium]|nr:PfkB family carbohydrate kinase [Deltaproteobacteria bacterium]